MSDKNKTPKKELNFFLIIPIILVSLVIILFIGDRYINQTSSSTPNQIDDNQYQAVFLENGQVYFGKITSEDNMYIHLEDIYYLQVNNQLGRENEVDNQSNLKLVKLGTEIHGPENEMRINYHKVLFIENLREDSEVVKVINEDKSNNQ
jgi:hypothetical protein